MAEISYRRHRFPPVIIKHAVWLYLRFTLSYRDVEELLAERRLDISYETIRCWVVKFGPLIARRLRRCRPRPSNRWHLDEMVVRIAGERMYLWRAVDHEGEVLDMLVQRRRDTRAALRLMRKLLKKQGFVPKLLVTDKLRSYACAFRRLRLSCRHEQGLRSRVDDWRGSVRFARLYCCPAAFARAGVAVRAVVPFPVAAHQTGHADFRHPAFTRPIRLSLSAGRRGASECGTARACHAGTPAGSARNRDRDLRFASPTSVAADD